MKRQGNLYAKICEPDNIRAAILNAAKGKRSRRDVQDVLANIDSRTAELSSLLADEEWTPAPYTLGVVHEGSKNKERQIRKPAYWPDQCVHWAIYQIIGPIIYGGFYDLSCGSVPGRGVHYGKKFVERWVRNEHKATKYYLKIDVHHFYPSIRPQKVLELLGRKFKDRQLMRAVQLVLAQYDGLPIGVLLSQLFANFYLTPCDFFIKKTLGAGHYLRYMDDMVIFGPSKRALHKMRVQIAEYLAGYGLELKSNWQVCRLDKEPLDFMGFRFYRDRTTLRRAIMLRITHKARKVAAHEGHITPNEAAGMVSYLGWIKHSDSRGLYEKWVRPYIHIQKLKNIIRKGARKHENSNKPKHRTPGRMGHREQPRHGIS